MRISLSLVALVAAAVSCRPAAAQITVTPLDAIPPIAVSPAFGPAAGLASTQYAHLGVVFSDRGAAGPSVPTAIFSDPPLAWAGVNGGGFVDLVSPVDGKFVVPGSLLAACTDFVEVEVGYAAYGSLLLELYALDGTLLASRVNGLDGFGPNGRTLISLTRPSADVASFRVSGLDTWGMNQIRFNTPVGHDIVPEPGVLALLIGVGFAPLVFLRRRR